MATFQKFNAFAEDVFEKKHNCAADTLKVMLTNTAPVAGNSVKADLTEIAAGNGYVAGGTQATTSSSSQTGGTYKLVVGDVVFTAVGGPVGPFRYAALYNDTALNDELIGFHDYGAPITLAAGETFTWDASAVNGIIQAS